MESEGYEQYDDDYNNQQTALPHYSDGSEQLMRWLLDSEDIVDQIEHKIRGEVYNSKLEKWEQKYHPLINETGVSIVMTVVNSHLTKNFKTGILTDDEIRMMAKSIRNDLIVLFYEKYEEFEIEKSNLNVLLNIIDNSIYNHLTTSKNGEFLKLLKSVTSIIQQKVERVDQHQGQSNILAKMFKRA